MSGYTDGFVIPILKENLDAYRQMAETAAKVWREYGALEYKECVGEDLETKDCGSFSESLSLKPEETVIFAWIRYESRAHRDEVNKKVMADPRISEACKSGAMPFDCQRMLYGGFEVLIDA